jgi:glutathione S-transferase
MAKCNGVPGVTDYYTFPPAPYALMVEIALREKGVSDAWIRDYERFIDLPTLENRCDAMLELNPHGTVPFFKFEDGSVVNETIAMMEYLDEVIPESSPLVGGTPQERCTVRMWQRRMEEHYVIPAYYGHRNWTASSDCEDDHFMKGFFSKRLTEEHGSTLIPHAWKDWLTWAKNRIVWLEKQKQTEKKKSGVASEYIAGNFLSTVDIQVYVTLWFFSEAFPYPPQKILEDLQGQLPWVQEWFDRVHARPAVVAARKYREESLADYEARKETGKRARNSAVPDAGAMEKLQGA